MSGNLATIIKSTEGFRAPYEPHPDPELREEIQGMNETMLEGLRKACKTDRYFLGRGVLGYKDINPYTHGPLCRALEDKTKRRRMYLQHRGSLKSTVGTIVDSVAEGLADPDECRILIVNEVELNAVGFLSEIKTHFETNDILKELFPDLIPKKFGGPGSKWSTDRACLNRSTGYKEWTWTAAGVGKALVGNHFSHIKADDLIGFEASQSAAAMRFAIAFAKSMEPLLIDMDENIIDFVGTRWAIYDLYREMLNIYPGDMSYFAREDIEIVPEGVSDEVLIDAGFTEKKGYTDLRAIRGTMQPIFPKKFSLKQLNRLARVEPVLYYAQYKNNPIADGIKDFRTDDIRWCDVDRNGHIVYRDPVTERLQRWTRDQVDIVMAVDPNSGELTAPDFPAIIIAAYSPLNQLFVLDAWSRRVQPDTFVQQMYEMWEYWQPRVCGVEKAGQQSIAFYFRLLANERKTYINIVPLQHKNREKTARIRKAIQPIIREGRLYLRKAQAVLQHQIRFHPDLDNDDEIDALAYVTELVITPASQKEQDDEEEAKVKVLATRSRTTGY